jgi:hypothetical protein
MWGVVWLVGEGGLEAAVAPACVVIVIAEVPSLFDGSRE